MIREFREVSRTEPAIPAEPALRIRVGTTTLDPADAPDGYAGLLKRARLTAELHNRDHAEKWSVEEERDYEDLVEARP
jgi:hypothetical protein